MQWVRFGFVTGHSGRSGKVWDFLQQPHSGRAFIGVLWSLQSQGIYHLGSATKQGRKKAQQRMIKTSVRIIGTQPPAVLDIRPHHAGLQSTGHTNFAPSLILKRGLGPPAHTHTHTYRFRDSFYLFTALTFTLWPLHLHTVTVLTAYYLNNVYCVKYAVM